MIKLDNIANGEQVWCIPERKRGVQCYQNNVIQRWYGFWCECARWCVHKILLQRVTNGKIADPSRTWSPYAYRDSPYTYGEGGQKLCIWGVPICITKLCAYWEQHIHVHGSLSHQSILSGCKIKWRACVVAYSCDKLLASHAILAGISIPPIPWPMTLSPMTEAIRVMSCRKKLFGR